MSSQFLAAPPQSALVILDGEVKETTGAPLVSLACVKPQPLVDLAGMLAGCAPPLLQSLHPGLLV